MKKQIHPFLWFENQAKEAADFYYSVFKTQRFWMKISKRIDEK